MSVDHPSPRACPTALKAPPEFLRVKPGDVVVVKTVQPVAHEQSEERLMGQVIFCEGGARDPRVNSLFQVADVDNGCVTWVNADEVTHILGSAEAISACT
jgi:hypothetical protein